VTAVILIGCAMLGTAGASGYRTYATAPGGKPAPVIIADSAPSKIVPMSELERQTILETIAQLNGDKLLAARMLGIGKTTLYRKLKEYASHE